MRVGILGSGEVGQKLGDGFIGLGHSVMVGSRSPGKLKAWVDKNGKKASAGSFAEAAAFGDALVLATLWTGTKDAIAMAGESSFAGKVVIDVTNPLDFTSMPPKLMIGYTDSAGETIQHMLPNSKVVKAFNTLGNPHMVRPEFPGGRPTMFLCGNDEGAKKFVYDVAFAFGHEPVDIGGIEGSRLLEPLAMLWIVHYFRTNSGNHAFKLLRK
jgi:predicted dinucleotide-binding enzyme